MNPYNPSGYRYAPPPKPSRPAWIVPVSIIAGIIFVVCALVGIVAIVAPSSQTSGNAALAGNTSRAPGGVDAALGGVAGGTQTPSASPSPAPAIAPVATPSTKPVTTKPATTKAPTTAPTHTTSPKPKPSTKPKPATCGAPANPWGLNFCGNGHTMTVSQLPSDVCGYFHCIDNFYNGNGFMIECSDGTYSMSGGIQGRCSHHGGDGHETVYRP